MNIPGIEDEDLSRLLVQQGAIAEELAIAERAKDRAYRHYDDALREHWEIAQKVRERVNVLLSAGAVAQ